MSVHCDKNLSSVFREHRSPRVSISVDRWGMLGCQTIGIYIYIYIYVCMYVCIMCGYMYVYVCMGHADRMYVYARMYECTCVCMKIDKSIKQRKTQTCSHSLFIFSFSFSFSRCLSFSKICTHSSN